MATEVTVSGGTRPRSLVMIATPLRSYGGTQDLPPQIGTALRELAERGRGAQLTIADAAFRVQADHYTFEWAAAVGGLARARNGLVHEFLRPVPGQPVPEWLLWHDSDLYAPDGMTQAEMILRLLSHRQPIVGALYCRRQVRPVYVATFMPAATLQAGADGLLQVAELGGGLKLYHIRAITELVRIFGPPPGPGVSTIMYRERETGEMVAGLYQQAVVDGDLLSEDYWLDYLCRCAQIPILADTKIRAQHRDADGTMYPGAAWPPLPVPATTVIVPGVTTPTPNVTP